MTIYGATQQGYRRKTLRETQDSIKQRILAYVGPNVDVSDECPTGQIIAAFAEEISQAREEAEQIYNAMDPDTAEGDALEQICKLTVTMRPPAAYTKVVCRVALQAGTTLLAGIHLAAVKDKPQSRWTPTEDFTATADGTFDVTFRAYETGPVDVEANKVTVIATPVVGWTSVTNSLGAVTLGYGVFDDTALRKLREEDVAKTGSGTLRALAAAVREVGGVISVKATQNTGLTTNADGLPAGHVEILVFDGVPPSADNHGIAQALYDKLAMMTRLYGTDSGLAEDEEGNAVEIVFSRVAAVPIHVALTLDIDEDKYPGDDVVKEALANAMNARLEPGDDVVALVVHSLPLAQPGVNDVPTFGIGTAASPTGQSNIPITPRQFAVFDSTRITITHA